MATVESNDLRPVHGRVSWSAIIAGAVVALATYLLLSVLGVALGLSISSQVGDRQLGIGALVWIIITMGASLFLGGWVTSQCTVGERRTEAVVYGVLLWGLVFALLLGLMASGVRLGINAVMGVASSPMAANAANLSEENLRAAGFTQEQINSMRGQFDRLRSPENLSQEIRTAAQDPRAAQAAWWTFGGMILSMFFAIAGALAGSGPDVLFSAFGVRSLVMRTDESHRQPVAR
jgi:hypothetical protein